MKPAIDFVCPYLNQLLRGPAGAGHAAFTGGKILFRDAGAFREPCNIFYHTTDLRPIMAYIYSWLAAINVRYGVNPAVFAALYILGVPPFWYALYIAGAALRKGKLKLMRFCFIIAGCINIVPFIYVFLFGRNLPSCFWIIISAIALLLFFPIIVIAFSSPPSSK